MKVNQIVISFPSPVDPPDGFYEALDRLVNMVCKKYEAENPTRVMWPAGHGAAPIWRKAEEPGFDETVYLIECSEREDFYGSNPHNPDAEELQAKRNRKKIQFPSEKMAERKALGLR